eukprot:GHVQ01005070.1.p1 GENE.GHVQ01005070.1~~GHVQ01005070.1.p1  ORF type:complete len:502 (-),score=56.55 GHVQ01005070.1:34-1539(-)
MSLKASCASVGHPVTPGRVYWPSSPCAREPTFEVSSVSHLSESCLESASTNLPSLQISTRSSPCNNGTFLVQKSPSRHAVSPFSFGCTNVLKCSNRLPNPSSQSASTSSASSTSFFSFLRSQPGQSSEPLLSSSQSSSAVPSHVHSGYRSGSSVWSDDNQLALMLSDQLIAVVDASTPYSPPHIGNCKSSSISSSSQPTVLIRLDGSLKDSLGDAIRSSPSTTDNDDPISGCCCLLCMCRSPKRLKLSPNGESIDQCLSDPTSLPQRDHASSDISMSASSGVKRDIQDPTGTHSVPKKIRIHEDVVQSAFDNEKTRTKHGICRIPFQPIYSFPSCYCPFNDSRGQSLMLAGTERKGVFHEPLKRSSLLRGFLSVTESLKGSHPTDRHCIPAVRAAGPVRNIRLYGMLGGSEFRCCGENEASIVGSGVLNSGHGGTKSADCVDGSVGRAASSSYPQCADGSWGKSRVGRTKYTSRRPFAGGGRSAETGVSGERAERQCVVYK